jgi:hypothetical protein
MKVWDGTVISDWAIWIPVLHDIRSTDGIHIVRARGITQDLHVPCIAPLTEVREP